MRLRGTLVAAALAVAAPANALGATLVVDPPKACYRSGETVALRGSGFSPSGPVDVMREGSPLGPLDADASGAFGAELTLALGAGQRTRTYTATDRSDLELTGSATILVTAVAVRLRPLTGEAGRVLRIDARGFKSGGTLWAHVSPAAGGDVLNVRIGKPSGGCGRLHARRRLVPASAPVGRYRIQFDDHGRFRPGRRFRDIYTVEVK
jgi:hypothetical protein